tara:strand:- start:1240 stop:1515 length:276 start_codon:yes stop_codon:yes gene_type:complete
MKQLLAVAVLSLFVSDTFADDWRMRKFDMNSDNYISFGELVELGCTNIDRRFRWADNNKDGMLNAKEARRASNVIFRSRCPRNPIPLGVRG